MKALSTTILIVVSAVVILIAALVVLTIFGGGMGQVTTITQAKNSCCLAAKVSCGSTNAMPSTWSITKMNVEGFDNPVACNDLPGLKDCKCENYKPECCK